MDTLVLAKQHTTATVLDDFPAAMDDKGQLGRVSKKSIPSAQYDDDQFQHSDFFGIL